MVQKDEVWLQSTSRFGTDALKYFVPFNERKAAIESVHCVETGGHLGIDKTLDKLKERFFWPELTKDVKTYIKECYHCQSVKAPKSYPVPPLIPITPSGTWQLVTMDIAGPLPETKDKNKYILAICDHFTKKKRRGRPAGDVIDSVPALLDKPLNSVESSQTISLSKKPD